MVRSEDRPDPEDDLLVCYCMRVHRGALVAAIRAGADTLAALRDRTRANTGCGTCRLELLQLLAEHRSARRPDPPVDPA